MGPWVWHPSESEHSFPGWRKQDERGSQEVTGVANLSEKIKVLTTYWTSPFSFSFSFSSLRR